MWRCLLILRLAVLMQYRHVMDRQTDGRTDRQTHDDSVYRASIASRGKNGKLYTWSNSTVSVSELAALDRVYMQLKH